MIERKELDKRIKVILGLCQKANSLPGGYGSETQQAADAEFWETLQALDEEAQSDRISGGPIAQAEPATPGRLVQFGVNDGYARYIVSRVGKRDCKLIHLPYMDAYHFAGVRDGEIPTNQLEDLLGHQDRLSELFKTKVKRRLVVAV